MVVVPNVTVNGATPPPKPDPVIVTRVPPVVGPLLGDTDVTLRASLKVTDVCICAVSPVAATVPVKVSEVPKSPSCTRYVVDRFPAASVVAVQSVGFRFVGSGLRRRSRDTPVLAGQP